MATFNSLPHNPDFKRPWVKIPLKTLWEKEKMLVASIFSFSHNVFNPIKDKNHHFKYLNLDQYKILSFGKELIDLKTNPRNRISIITVRPLFAGVRHVCLSSMLFLILLLLLLLLLYSCHIEATSASIYDCLEFVFLLLSANKILSKPPASFQQKTLPLSCGSPQ